MNILRTLVKETLLLPVRVVQGITDALSEVVEPAEDKEKKS